MSYVTVREVEQQQYILLKPGTYLPRTALDGLVYTGQLLDWNDLPQLLNCISSTADYVAVDFETRGGDPSDDLEIVGVGLAWSAGYCYVPFSNQGTRLLSEANRKLLLDYLSGETAPKHITFLCHNFYFDGGVLRCTTGTLPASSSDSRSSLYLCTYAILAMLHNEGYPGTTWGLKTAMVELLGWESSNDTDLDEWLVVNGYYKGHKMREDTPENRKLKYDLGSIAPEKGYMWKAPMEILGKYCALDAEATYLLYTEVLAPVMQRFPDFDKFVREEFMYLIYLLVEQKMLGITVDRPGLLSRAEHLEKEIDSLISAFRVHPNTIEHITKMESALTRGLLDGAPSQFKKNGEVSKNWLNWKDKYERALAGELPEYKFNSNSNLQLADLFYSHMGMEVRVSTESGRPGTGTKALKHFGEAGALLVDAAYARKELSYISDYIYRTEYRSTIHPSFRTPGTTTGRLSSKTPNMQQIPKSKAVMGLFQARAGHVWVDLDFAALEAVVATEFSQDPNLLALYGNGVAENDIHLFVASMVPGEMGDTVKKTGYRPIDPPPGSVGRAKKEAKHWRNIAKTVVYACQFGAGVNKVMETLENDDVFLEYDLVKIIHSTYWNTFSGLRDLQRKLFFEWKKNGGYILNGLGRPMAVPKDWEKDLLSRFIQSTGHDILVRYVGINCRELDRRNIPWTPVIVDLHDATTVEVPEEYADRAMEVFNDSMTELNTRLNGIVRMRGTPTVGVTLAEVKECES